MIYKFFIVINLLLLYLCVSYNHLKVELAILIALLNILGFFFTTEILGDYIIYNNFSTG